MLISFPCVARSVLAVVFSLFCLEELSAQVSFTDARSRIPFLRSGGSGLGGAALLDYDNDGDLDIFITNGKGKPNALLQNDGKGNFKDVAATAGVTGMGGYSGVVAGDLDNDGWPDLFLIGEGGLMTNLQSPTKLYRNLGNGKFQDVTATANVPGAQTSISAALADFDGDGLLDIFITSPGSLATKTQHKNTLYRNLGGMKFVDISSAAGIDTALGACAVSCLDYDRDGRQDILVAVCNNVFFSPTPFKLFHNDGKLKFTNSANKVGLSGLGFWMCVALGDIDNDGQLDVFATNLGNSVPVTQPHALYKRTPSGGFSSVAASAGVANHEFGWGASFADFDNDGDQDLFMAGSLPAAPFNIIGPGKGNPGRLFFNDGSGKFTQVSGTQPVNMSSMFTTGVVQGDLDGNGFADILVVTHAISFTQLGKPVLLLNKGNGNHWLAIKPVAASGNKAAVGAFIELWSGGKKQVRAVRAGGSFASSETPWPSFGLAKATVATVRITWPSGRKEVFAALAADKRHTLSEGKGGATATFTALGTGCKGTAGIPSLTAANAMLPWIGSSLTLRVSNMPKPAAGVLFLGISKTKWATIPLPLKLDFLGMTGCSLFISADLAFAFASQQGRVDLPLAIPNEPIFVGARFYNQALVVDRPANSHGATMSNASEAVIGAK